MPYKPKRSCSQSGYTQLTDEAIPYVGQITTTSGVKRCLKTYS
ncbi:MAG: hypothetical protein PQJ48_10335 [Sphaerochaetaceae bacterium]|nr:hypothetical protein [Sphaerochaetaceae bacterium]